MVDTKLQEIKRSISSWSLSTIKRPTLSASRLKGAKLRLFRARRKNRAAAEESEGKSPEEAGSSWKDGDCQERESGVPAAEGSPEDINNAGLEGPLASLKGAGMIQFIDFAPGEKDEIPHRLPTQKEEEVYSEEWWDAGTDTPSRSRMRLDEDYENYQAGTFYDAAQEQKASKCSLKYEDVSNPTSVNANVAKEWVASYNKDAFRRGEAWKAEYKGGSSLGHKSCSDMELNKGDSINKRDEIVLNAPASSSKTSSFWGSIFKKDFFTPRKKRHKGTGNTGDSLGKEELVRKESYKKVFEVRGKLAVKSVVDNRQLSYQKADLYIASTPMALVSRAASNEKKLSTDSNSTEGSEGLLNSSIELEPSLTEKFDEILGRSADISTEEHDDSELEAASVQVSPPKPCHTEDIIRNIIPFELTDIEAAPASTVPDVISSTYLVVPGVTLHSSSEIITPVSSAGGNTSLEMAPSAVATSSDVCVQNSQELVGIEPNHLALTSNHTTASVELDEGISSVTGQEQDAPGLEAEATVGNVFTPEPSNKSFISTRLTCSDPEGVPVSITTAPCNGAVSSIGNTGNQDIYGDETKSAELEKIIVEHLEDEEDILNEPEGSTAQAPINEVEEPKCSDDVFSSDHISSNGEEGFSCDNEHIISNGNENVSCDNVANNYTQIPKICCEEHEISDDNETLLDSSAETASVTGLHLTDSSLIQEIQNDHHVMQGNTSNLEDAALSESKVKSERKEKKKKRLPVPKLSRSVKSLFSSPERPKQSREDNSKQKKARLSPFRIFRSSPEPQQRICPDYDASGRPSLAASEVTLNSEEILQAMENEELQATGICSRKEVSTDDLQVCTIPEQPEFKVTDAELVLSDNDSELDQKHLEHTANHSSKQDECLSETREQAFNGFSQSFIAEPMEDIVVTPQKLESSLVNVQNSAESTSAEDVGPVLDMQIKVTQVNGETLTENVNMPSDVELSSGETPKPAPRTKKSRYGYSGKFDGVSQKNLKLYSESGNKNKPTSCVYNTEEHIYWEIPDSNVAPAPCPRSSKVGKVSDGTVPTKAKQDLPHSRSHIQITDSADSFPNWIKNRGPVPNPRTKKSKKNASVQSIQSAISSEDAMAIAYTQLIGSRPGISDGLYSGKAASIAYGMTPEVPMRCHIRNPSLTSLPANSSCNEDAFVVQEKRLSVQAFPKKVIKAPSRGTLKCKRKAPARPQIQRRTLAPLISTRLEAQKDTLLEDVLYSTHFLMGEEANDKWSVVSGLESRDTRKRNSVTSGQITSELKESFQMNDDTMTSLLSKALSRKPLQVTLNVTVNEAKNLRPQNVKGTCNSYVVVSILGSSETHRTVVETNTLSPRWNQSFGMRIKNIQKDSLKVEVWHQHDALSAHHITAIRDIKSIGRFMKETSAFAHNQALHLLGSVTIPLREIGGNGIDNWFPLQKDEDSHEPIGGIKNVGKYRGCVFLSARIVSTASLSYWSRHSYDDILAVFVHHHVTKRCNNNQGENSYTPWNGALNFVADGILSQHALVLGLSGAVQHLSWFIIGTREPKVDNEWLLGQLCRVIEFREEDMYTDIDLSDLNEALVVWIKARVDTLKDLHALYPYRAEEISQHQLIYILRIFRMMENDAKILRHLAEGSLDSPTSMAKAALESHRWTWWTSLIESNLRGARTPEEQIERVINITAETFFFFNVTRTFYNAIFYKELDLHYFKDTYINLTKRINPCVRPLLMNICSKASGTDYSEDLTDSGDPRAQMVLEAGTNLWQLYMNLGKLHRMGEDFPAITREESGIKDYHRWFSRGVMRWLRLAVQKAKSMIKKAVQLDSFESVDEYCNFSSSATDTTAIFHDVKIWWQNLQWPDPENSGMIVAKILEDICSCGTHYCDLLSSNMDALSGDCMISQNLLISEKICVALNNIERVQKEMQKLPEMFCVNELVKSIEQSANGGIQASAQLTVTVSKIIESASEDMEKKLMQFTEFIVKNVSPSMEKAIEESCDSGSYDHFLSRTLDPNMELLKNRLNEVNFKRLLLMIWEEILLIFDRIVTSNKDRRKASYFNNVHNMIKLSYAFFVPSSDIGIDASLAFTPAYENLLELTENLGYSAETLISKYYKERQADQENPRVTSRGQVVVKALFSRNNKLIVEVIMAKDFQQEEDAISINSKSNFASHLGGSHAVNAYVKAQLVPSEWFEQQPVRKTHTIKSDPAVFEETFEFDLAPEDNGVSEAFLLVTLKDYNLARTNTFLGEAVLALADLPVLDSAQMHTAKNQYLKMTSPSSDLEYRSLAALKLKVTDKMAIQFLKRVVTRFADSKTKELLLPPSPRLRLKSS